MSDDAKDNAGVRIDIWLFRARFAKSRAVAAERIASGRIRLERQGQINPVRKPAQTVQPGDFLTLPLKSGPLRIEICALGTRRGPAAEAMALYRVVDIAGP
ncbi:MAG: ribosome-associated heat shock protein Hsp15 HslR [Oceanicaulis sp. HLUCCA04]|nr:MAG: ribosome-associated heat shock protein Hsp15 HslR [Oceanicaulis sp. HLUCCA04]